jgi:predicted small lipoprotein YifL
MRRSVFCLALLVAAAGCGQRGALFLRESPPPGYKPPKVDTYKPVPYPKDSDTERGSTSEK